MDFTEQLEKRITPACAGNSSPCADAFYTVRDHPRVCGEQDILDWLQPDWVGSPPRVRGTAVQIPGNIREVRITPACAGNSRRPTYKGLRSGDHPRVCGEQYDRLMETSCIEGSPPRVRGTAPEDKPVETNKRITPACAGNSILHCANMLHLKDHPRVCGEQAIFHPDKIPVGGSPPRVRGTVQRLPGSRRLRRITPACAGNSGCI